MAKAAVLISGEGGPGPARFGAMSQLVSGGWTTSQEVAGDLCQDSAACAATTDQQSGSQPHGTPGVKVGGAAQQNRKPVGDQHSVLVGLAPQHAQAEPAHLESSQQRHHGPFLRPNHVDTKTPQEPEVGQERRITGS